MPHGNSATHGHPVDAHVHFHRMEYVEPALDAAVSNFSEVTVRRGPLLGTLLLAESANERVFEALLDGNCLEHWRFSRVEGEPQSLIAESNNSRVAVICGRQIRCESGLEVLALGTTSHFPSDAPLSDAIRLVRASGALAVLPWGFGKWSGSRGRIIRDALDDSDGSKLFVGDNGGRIAALGEPALLRVARRKGFRVIPGSDPFPFGRDCERVGRFGFFADIAPDPRKPWAPLRHWLESYPESPQPYGHGLGPFRFICNQLRIQLHNRLARS